MRCIQCAYPLQGLLEPRCPECGKAFDPSDGATWAADNAPPRRALAVAASFAGAFPAWVLVLVCWLAADALLGGPAGGFGVMVMRKSLSIAPAPDQAANCIGLFWLTVVLPAHLFPRIVEIARRIRGALLLGTSFGLLAGLILESVMFYWNSRVGLTALPWALLAGIVIELTIHAALRPTWTLSERRTPRRRIAALWIAPIAVAALWHFAFWPLICDLAPNMALRYGPFAARLRAVRIALQDIQVGDPVTKLTDRLPDFRGLDAGSGSMSGSTSANPHLFFKLEYVGGRFTRVEY